jgi:hypothetical protein
MLERVSGEVYNVRSHSSVLDTCEAVSVLHSAHDRSEPTANVPNHAGEIRKRSKDYSVVVPPRLAQFEEAYIES